MPFQNYDPSECGTPEDALAEIRVLAEEHEQAIRALEAPTPEQLRSAYQALCDALEEELPHLLPVGDARDALQLYIEARRNLAVL